MKYRAPLNRRIGVFALVMTGAACLAISYAPLSRIEALSAPELQRKISAISDSATILVEKALRHGVPPRSLSGMENFFCSYIRDNPEIGYVALTEPGGRVLFYAARENKKCRMNRAPDAMTRRLFRAPLKKTEIDGADFHNSLTPVMLKGKVVAGLWAGAPRTYIRSRLKDILNNILTVVAVSFLLTFELVLFIVTYSVSGPLIMLKEGFLRATKGDLSRTIHDHHGSDELGVLSQSYNSALITLNDRYEKLRKRFIALGERAQSASLRDYFGPENRNRFVSPGDMSGASLNLLIYIRPALFLLVFSESLSLSFFPLYVDQLYKPIPGISRELVIGAPISIFMFFWAISLPSAGGWSDRIGRRKPLLAGALLTGSGLLMTAFASGLFDLLLWRSLTAVGYGIVFITCQGYIIDNSSARFRGRGMALFLSGFFSGSLCGASTGGILAEYIGYRPTFILSAFFSLAAALFVFYFIREEIGAGKRDRRKFSFADVGLLFSNGNFLALTFLVAIPAKLALVGLLYYAGPIYLKELNVSQSSIGRALMLYGLAIIVISPLAARYSDTVEKRKKFVISGAFLSSFSLIILYWERSYFGMLAGVGLLGLSHAISGSSLLALVTEFCGAESEKIGSGTVMGIFRLVERLGNISGPLLLGTLTVLYRSDATGTRDAIPMAIASLGVLTFAAACAFFLVQFAGKAKRLSPAPGEASR